MWICENCKHWNKEESKVCERYGISREDSRRREMDRENQEEIEQIESDMWDEDQGLM